MCLRPAILAAVLACWTGWAGAQDSGGNAAVEAWVRDLGSDSFEKREAASEGLAKAGWEARGAVKEALKSDDAEVQRRAKALWERLRWLVVPGADEDVMALVRQCGKDKSPEADAWKAFAKKHGAPVLFLLTQLRLSGDEKNYRNGLRAALPQCPASALGKVLRSAKDDREREVLGATLLKADPENLDDASALRVAEVFNLLWMCPEAFDFSRTAWMKFHKSALVRQAANAMVRGEFQERVWKEGLEAVPKITSANEQAYALSFYLDLSRRSGERDRAAPLVEKVVLEQKKGSMPDTAALYELFGQMMESDFEKEAEVLAEKQEGMNVLHLRLYFAPEDQKEKAWDNLVEGLNRLDPEEAEGKAFAISEQMEEWDDGRRVKLLEWILHSEPNDSVYDLNALFRLISMCEQSKRLAREGVYLEQAAEMMPKVGGVLIGTSKEDLMARKERLQKRTAWYFKTD